MSEHLNDKASHQEFWAEIVEAGGPASMLKPSYVRACMGTTPRRT